MSIELLKPAKPQLSPRTLSSILSMLAPFVADTTRSSPTTDMLTWDTTWAATFVQQSVLPVKAILSPDTVRNEDGQVVVEGLSTETSCGVLFGRRIVYAGPGGNQSSGDFAMTFQTDPNEFAVASAWSLAVVARDRGRAAVDRFLGWRCHGCHAARGTLDLIDGVELVQADLTTAEGGAFRLTRRWTAWAASTFSLM